VGIVVSNTAVANDVSPFTLTVLPADRKQCGEKVRKGIQKGQLTVSASCFLKSQRSDRVDITRSTALAVKRDCSVRKQHSRARTVRTLESIASMTEIFEETLDPPTIAAKGLFGTSTAPRGRRRGTGE
jgi:hypothetical protein